MNNFNVVFTLIKEYCKEPHVPDHKCFAEIEKMVESNKVYLSTQLYLEILSDMGLKKFNIATKAIMLTDKGMSTDHIFEP